ncbi:MAG: ATP-binding protein [Candidatus Bathyarchaeota archaeon]|nr:ATP-binding protein [Candidatus Bathyarchaeota archaeon]
MIISVASGKGGTGKTSVAVNMALSVGNLQLLDCDVEEPNAHLLLHPEITRKEPVYTQIPKVDQQLCNGCGECAKTCQFHALFVAAKNVMIFPELCHSCGGCALVCPQKAITWEKHEIGTLNFGKTDSLELVFGELTVSKPLAIPVIKAVKNQLNPETNVIVDSPPGTSCSFVETVRGSDFCILVTEPTPFGLHDLTIAVEVLRRLSVPFGVVVNRAGVGDRKLYQYCQDEGIQILLEIPYDRRIAELYSRGTAFVLEMPQWKEKFQALYKNIKETVKK